ncbi:MAG: hypothetical protein WDM79_10350 [Terricaulis sp.]
MALFAVAPAAAAEGESYTAQTGEGQYAVIYRGDRSMSRRDVANNAILKAAELTLESGNEIFVVNQTTTSRIDLSTVAALNELDRSGGSARDTGAGAGSGASGTSSGGGGVGAATAGVDPGAVGVGTGVDPRLLERRRTRMAYQTVLMIRVGRRGQELQVEDPNAQLEIFDAASVATSLRAELH